MAPAFPTAAADQNYRSLPFLDHFVHLIHPRTGLKSLAEIKEKKFPLRLSIREDATHSTRVLVDQTLALYGMTLNDIESWGGSFQLNGGPGDQRRLDALSAGTSMRFSTRDCHFGLMKRLPPACGRSPWTMPPLNICEPSAGGKSTIRPGRFKNLKENYTCIDYSGWPLYTRASLPDDDAYKVCEALSARKDEIYWEDSYTGIGQLGEDTDATPRDIPLHPGAEKWYREHGFKV